MPNEWIKAADILQANVDLMRLRQYNSKVTITKTVTKESLSY